MFSSNTIDDYLKKEEGITWKIWIVIIILIIFIGVNGFIYLAKGTEYMKKIFGWTTNNLVVPKPSIPVAMETRTPGSDIVKEYPDIMLQNALNRTINTKRAEEDPQNAMPIPIDENGKWCYVGKFDGQRTCQHLANDDTCASGNIFPTIDICINPSLRT